MDQDGDDPATPRPAARAGELGARGTAAPVPGADRAAVAGGRRAIDAASRARIGRGLRRHYADVLALPIPERLRTLIDDLAAGSDTEVKR